MSDSDKELKIKISTAADTSGAEAALKALKKVGDQEKIIDELRFQRAVAASRGEDITKYDTAIHKLGVTLDDHARQAGKSEERHRGLAKVFRLLGQETVPELGHALESLHFGPEIAGMLLFGLAVEVVTKKLGELNKKVEDHRAEQAQLTTDVWNAQRDALNEVAEAGDKFIAAIQKIPGAMAAASAAEKDELEILKAGLAARLQILDAMEKAEKARATTPEQTAEIESRYGHRKTNAELSGEEAQIRQLNQQRTNRIDQHDPLRAKAAADEKAAEAAHQNTETMKQSAELKIATAKQPALDKAELDSISFWGGGSLAAMKQHAEDLKQRHEADHSDDNLLTAWVAAKTQYEAAQKAADEAQANRQHVAELNKPVEAAKINEGKLKTRADESLKAYQDNESAMRDLAQQIKSLTDVFTIHANAARAVSVEEYTKPGAAENVVTSAVSAITDAHSGKFTADDKNAIENLQNLLSTIGFNSTLVIGALSASKDLHRDATNEITAIKAAIEKLSHNIPQYGSPGPWTVPG